MVAVAWFSLKNRSVLRGALFCDVYPLQTWSLWRDKTFVVLWVKVESTPQLAYSWKVRKLTCSWVNGVFEWYRFKKTGNQFLYANGGLYADRWPGYVHWWIGWIIENRLVPVAGVTSGIFGRSGRQRCLKKFIKLFENVFCFCGWPHDLDSAICWMAI